MSLVTCVLCLFDSFLSRSTDRNMTLWETDSTSTLPGEVAKGIVRRVENHMVLSMTWVSICAKVSVHLSIELMQIWYMLCQRELDSFRIWYLTYTWWHVVCRNNPFSIFKCEMVWVLLSRMDMDLRLPKLADSFSMSAKTGAEHTFPTWFGPPSLFNKKFQSLAGEKQQLISK